jgi:predicted acyl esterase
MKLKEITGTIQAVGPLLINAIKSGQLFHPQCELTEPDEDIMIDYDVKVPMSEGFSLTANVFRSKKAEKNGEKVPIVMCAHPYDNHLTPALRKTPFSGPPQQYRLIP